MLAGYVVAGLAAFQVLNFRLQVFYLCICMFAGMAETK
jgi:hypothetical protein